MSSCNEAVNNQVEHQVQMQHAFGYYKILCQYSTEHQPTGRSKRKSVADNFPWLCQLDSY